MSQLTSDAQTFCADLAEELNLSLRVVQAWCLAETSGGNSGLRAYNFLNVGNTDSNPFGGERWTSPADAALGTAQWLRDNPRSGQVIIASAGLADSLQLQAIAASPFSSSHYGPAGHPGQWLLADYASLPKEVSLSPDFAPVAVVSLCVFEFGGAAAAAAVTPEGAVYCYPASAYCGGANGEPYFAGRSAVHISALPGGGYEIQDSAGEVYQYPQPLAAK